MQEFNTLAIALINYLKETTEKQLLFFDLKGSQNSLLMHVPLSCLVGLSMKKVLKP